MERSRQSQNTFIHPSRAHLFQKAPVTDNANHTVVKHASRTWNNRRDRSQEKQKDDLLVFGYASKLFPPNEQSSAIAKNKHLIAWNEDFSLNLLIDRYDCRASLHNLSDFDEDSWNRTHQLSEEEAKLEAHLNEERYRALFVEELEEDIRQEEELKRLHASIDGSSVQSGNYGEVKFQYDGDAGEQYDPTEPTTNEEDQKPFIAPSSLAIPKEMEIPATEKMHAIIEKTANFVSKQGAQMEIVLKAKQANNSQFQFLQFGHYLNPYYKHVVKRMKEGKYTPGILQPSEAGDEEDSDSSDDQGDYLHPSLFAASHKKAKEEEQERTKAMRTVDPDHPLAKLIEKGRQANAMKQYQKMAQAVYSYYSQQQGSSDVKSTVENVEPPPLPSFMSMSSLPSSGGVSESQLPSSYAPMVPTTTDTGSNSSSQNAPAGLTEAPWKGDIHIVPPPPDLQALVEEIAKKVAVEGSDSEKALICQAESNYSFLNPWHELHPYYQFRKMFWIRMLFPPPPPDVEVAPVKPEDAVDENSKSSTEQVPDPDDADETPKLPIPSGPISFSIKTRKDGPKKPLPLATSSTTSVLGDPDSDEENESPESESVEKFERPAKRRFTDNPPDPVNTTQILTSTTNQPVSLAFVNTTTVLPAKPSGPPPPPSQPVSSFTAVTPSGESASISDLREKQAARRQRALLFLKAKKKQGSHSAKPTDTSTIAEKTADDSAAMAAIASEDIFDLSADQDLESKPADVQASKETEDSSNNSISKLEILQSLGSISQTSSPRSSPGISGKRSRSRTRDSSYQRYAKTRDLSSLHSMSKLSYSVLDSPSLSRSRSGSPAGDDVGVPSAYRVENASRREAARGSRALKKKRKKSPGSPRDRRHSHRSHSNDRRSKRANKHSRSSKRSPSGERKKKKRKKEKKERKRRRKAKSASGSSDEDEDKIDGERPPDEDGVLEDREDGEVTGSADDEVNSESDYHRASPAGDVMKEEPSEGEIVSD